MTNTESNPSQPIERVTTSGDLVLKCGKRIAPTDNIGTKPYNLPIWDDVTLGKGGTNSYISI